jgi:threonine dehydratase
MAGGRTYDLGKTFVRPFADRYFVAGQGTIRLELIEDLPGYQKCSFAVGGGGLCTGISSAVKAVTGEVRVYGGQASGAAPLPASIRAGRPRC